MRLLRRCERDWSYTLRDKCPMCGGETVSAHPPRFSPEDRMVKYRLLARGKKC